MLTMRGGVSLAGSPSGCKGSRSSYRQLMLNSSTLRHCQMGDAGKAHAEGCLLSCSYAKAACPEFLDHISTLPHPLA